MHYKWTIGNIVIVDSTHNFYSPSTFTVKSEKKSVLPLFEYTKPDIDFSFVILFISRDFKTTLSVSLTQQPICEAFGLANRAMKIFK